MHSDRSADQCRLVYSNTLDMIASYTVARYPNAKYPIAKYKATTGW